MDRVYQVTGFPVDVSTDPRLTVRVSVRSAHPGQPGHLIQLSPKAEEQADYWVAMECFLLLRIWAVPYEEQREFRTDKDKERYLADKMAHLASFKGMPPRIVSEMAQMYFMGVLKQMRSYPCSLRASKALRQEFPGLDTLQRAAEIAVLQENSGALDPKIKAMASPMFTKPQLR